MQTKRVEICEEMSTHTVRIDQCRKARLKLVGGEHLGRGRK